MKSRKNGGDEVIIPERSWLVDTEFFQDCPWNYFSRTPLILNRIESTSSREGPAVLCTQLCAGKRLDLTGCHRIIRSLNIHTIQMMFSTGHKITNRYDQNTTIQSSSQLSPSFRFPKFGMVISAILSAFVYTQSSDCIIPPEADIVHSLYKGITA